MTKVPAVIIVARNREIAWLIARCARKELGFDELCRKVHAMGYNTAALHEMVRQEEVELKALDG